MTKGYLGIDIGSISTKGVIIDENRAIIARSYLWTEGNRPRRRRTSCASWKERQVEGAGWIMSSALARRAVRGVSSGAMLGASVIRARSPPMPWAPPSHPDVRTILEIGGQDSRSSACPTASRWTTP